MGMPGQLMRLGQLVVLLGMMLLGRILIQFMLVQPVQLMM